MPTASDPSTGWAWPSVWNTVSDPLNLVRAGGELFRVVPVLGGFTGLGADIINGYQDVTAYEAGDAGGWSIAFAVTRNLINAGNNAFGALLSADQILQNILLGLGVTAEAAAATALINTTLKPGKVLVDLCQMMVDFGGILVANANKAEHPAHAELWQSMIDGYIANTMTDFFAIILDGIDAGSAGLTQGSVIQQTAQAAKGGKTLADYVMANKAAVLLGMWNVFGGGVFVTPEREHLQDPATLRGIQARIGRMPADRADGGGARIQRAAGTGDMVEAVAWSIAIAELQKMRLGYDIGDTVLGALGEMISQFASDANEMAIEYLDGREPLQMVKEAAASVFDQMATRIQALEEMEAMSASAAELADGVRGAADEALAALDGLRIPDVELPEPELGDNAVADAAESLIGVGADVAEAGLDAALAPAEAALELAKSGIAEVIAPLKENADEIGAFMRLVMDNSRVLIEYIQGWLEEFSQRFADTESFEQIMELLVNEAIGVAGLETEFSFDALREAWHDLGPAIDDMITYAQAKQAEAAGGAPAGEPPDIRPRLAGAASGEGD